MAGFEHHRHVRVAAYLDDLLGFGLGPQPDVVVEPSVLHGHQMRDAVGSDGGEGGCAGLVDEVDEFGVGHRDLRALAGHAYGKALIGAVKTRRNSPSVSTAQVRYSGHLSRSVGSAGSK